MYKDKVIVIVGATASKKTSLAIKLLKYLNAEIINADAFQIFKELNIGTNKPTNETINTYHLHLINQLAINEPIDISIYQNLCTQTIKQILNNHKIPILCGGSNLYIDAVIRGYNLNKIPSREKITYFNNWKYDDIYEYVLKNDSATALKINKNNQKRIIRAAQLIYVTNQKKDELEKETKQFIYDCLIIETILDREILYQKINDRVDEMQKNGWEQEVRLLLNKYPNFLSYQASKALGYNDIAKAIENKQTIDWELIKQKTRNYAKKQLTWNRNKYPNKIVFDVTKDDFNSLLACINNFLNS